MASQALTPADGSAIVAAPSGAGLPSAGGRFAAFGPVKGLLAQPAVKRSLPLLAALALVAAALLAWSAVSTPPQKILFSGLPDADKAAVSEALGQAGIANRVDPSTGTLTVSEEDYYRARMLLAQQDLPKAAPGGYAILDQLPMGVSRAVEGERLRQARETELARSIGEIDAVADARVHLATPEASVFVRDTAAPSASVIVRLQPGRTLSEAQVRSIVNLVASSVPGMNADNVTIVDGTGQLLTRRAGTGGADAASDERIEFQARVEDKYRGQLAQLLTPLVGAGNFTAEVQADINLDQSEATREQYQPQGTVRSEQESWTGGGGAETGGAGIPGTLANQPPTATEVRAGETAAEVPGADPAAAPGAAGARTQASSARSYEVGREISVTRAAPGSVRRLSVAVVLRDPEGARPRTAQELEQLTGLVRSAVGFDPARNDQVTVISRQFAGASDAAADEAPWYEAGWVPMAARNGTALVIALLILLLGVRPLVKSLARRKEADPLASGNAAGAATQVQLPDGTVVTAAAGAAPREPVSIEMLDSARGYDDKVSLVRDFTRDNPARAALAVRDMIQGDAARAGR